MLVFVDRLTVNGINILSFSKELVLRSGWTQADSFLPVDRLYKRRYRRYIHT